MSTSATRICPECETRTREKNCPKCRTGTMPASMVASDGDDLVGTRLGQQYELNAVLGRGGMGVVYRATQLSMDRPVAIKVISSSLTRDLSVVKRFQREARVTSKLSHPNTIRVYDFGLTEDGILYLVMELLEGRELSKVIKVEAPMPLQRCASIAIQVLKSLNEAHGLGIIHRDLKPANIFMQKVQGQGDLVKVMDFGIAKLVAQNDQTANLTQAGLLVGTPYYMSPEQVQGGEVGPRSDIYSLGIILFQMLCGRVPFQSETPVAVLMAHAQEPAPAVATFRKDLAGNTGLQEVMDRLLAKDPAQRPVSALHAISLLQKLVPGTIEPGELAHLDTGNFEKIEVTRQRDAPRMDTPISGELKTLARVERRGDGQPVGPQDDTRLLEEVRDGDMLAPPNSDGDGAFLPAAVDANANTSVSAAPPTASVENEPPPAPARSRAPLMVGLAAALLGLGGGAWAISHLSSQPAPAPRPVTQSPQPTPAVDAAVAPPAPARVLLKVRTTPEGARVLLDGNEVGVSPLERELEPGVAVEVRVEKAGYEALQTRVEASAPRTLEWTLKPAPSSATPASKPDRVEKPARNPKPPRQDSKPRKKKSDVDLLEDL